MRPPPVNLEAWPAPAGVLAALHWVAEFAYTVPMNLALGWPLMTLMAEGVGASRGDTSLRRLAAWIARRTPGAVTFALVLAFPPFVLGHVLHPAAWFEAEHRMGVLWFAVIPLVFVASGAAFWVALRRRGTEPSTLRPFLPDVVESYLLAFRRRGLERPGLALTVLASLALLGLGFVFTVHAVLASSPAPSFGLPLHRADLLPRLVHVLLGALAVSGLAVAWHGADRVADGEAGYGRIALKFGVLWLAVPTALQVFAGPWFLFSLPPEAARPFLGHAPRLTLAVWGGAGLGIGAAALGVFALFARDPRTPVRIAAACLAGALAAMTAARQHLRLEALAAAAAPAVLPQRGMMTVFAVSAVAAAAVLGYMLWVAALPRLRSGRSS